MYYTHIDDKDVSLDETLETLDGFVKSGKVKAIGCSNYQKPRLHEALTISRYNTWTAFSCIQQRYTYLQPDPKVDFGVQVVADDELLDYCYDHNMTVLAYSPLLGGAYTRADQLPQAYKNSYTNEKKQVLQDIAAEAGASINQIVLAWMQQKPRRVIPLIAASSSDQLAENLASQDILLTSEQIERLNRAAL
ncbi:L-glyceraldehyde 3-phosphate reductase [compost metagenome]